MVYYLFGIDKRKTFFWENRYEEKMGKFMECTQKMKGVLISVDVVIWLPSALEIK